METITPTAFFESLKENHSIPSENSKINDFVRTVDEQIELEGLDTVQAQLKYRRHIIGDLENFSGHISGYEKLIAKFGYKYALDFYPNLDTHINVFCHEENLSEELQKLVEELVNNMYEHVHIIKNHKKDEFEPSELLENNYSLTWTFASKFGHTEYWNLIEEVKVLIPNYIQELIVMRQDRLRIAKEIEEKMFTTETILFNGTKNS